MLRLLSLIIFKLCGWKAVDYIQYPSKCVVIAAPHTSNWDFLIGRCYGYIQKIQIRYLIKSEFFYPILGFLIKLNGGIPVFRKHNNNLVNQINTLFNSSDNLILALAPEGTRKNVPRWKTGFYQIALKSNVPVVLCKLDFKNKKIGIFEKIHPSGDFEKDMKFIENSYKNVVGKIPENFNPNIF